MRASSSNQYKLHSWRDSTYISIESPNGLSSPLNTPGSSSRLHCVCFCLLNILFSSGHGRFISRGIAKTGLTTTNSGRSNLHTFLASASRPNQSTRRDDCFSGSILLFATPIKFAINKHPYQGHIKLNTRLLHTGIRFRPPF